LFIYLTPSAGCATLARTHSKTIAAAIVFVRDGYARLLEGLMGWHRLDKTVVGVSVAWVLLMGAGLIESLNWKPDPAFCGGLQYQNTLCFMPSRYHETQMIGLMVTIVPPIIFLLISFLWNRLKW
jgi:hypothetical protein